MVYTFKLYSHLCNLCVLAVYIWFVNVSTVTLSNIKTHLLLLLQTLPYPSLSNPLEGLHFSVSLGSLVLLFSRWHISVGIISLLQDAAALTIFMYLCTRHTCTTACMYLNAANMQMHNFMSLHLLAAWCLRGCFVVRTAIRGTRRGVTKGMECVRMVCVYERETRFKEMCGTHYVCVGGEWGLFCCPWKNHWVFRPSDRGYFLQREAV